MCACVSVQVFPTLRLRCMQLGVHFVEVKPYTLHPTPYTLHPIPHTLHPTPYTLYPPPYTLNPKGYTRWTSGGACQSTSRSASLRCHPSFAPRLDVLPRRWDSGRERERRERDHMIRES